MTVTDDEVLVEGADVGAMPQAEPASAAPAAPAAEPEVRGLDPRFVTQQRVIGWIVTACLSLAGLVAVAIVLLAADDLALTARLLLLPAWLVFTAAIGWLFYAWPAVHFRHVSYRVDADGIEIRSGVWWRTVMSVPRSRVQHIDVSQGPMERHYGLGRLVLYTAGTDHSRVELVGLEHGVALALRHHLLPRGADDAV
jgi:uncharacterized protein